MQIHFGGTNCSNCGLLNMGYVMPFNGVVIQKGDVIAWRQMQSGPAVPRGGLGMFFGDGTETNWITQDQNGETMNNLSTQNAWVYRVVDLSAHAGKTVTMSFINNDSYSGAGNWDEYFSDIAFSRADGTVIPIYNGQPSVGFTTYGSSGVTNTTFAVEQVADSNQMNTTHFYIGDHLGSAQMEFTASGWPASSSQFAPYGEEINPQITTNHYKFTGKERDTESGMDYFGARYYGSSMGRFMSPDFTGVGSDPVPVPSADFENPQSLNLYSYVQNNPLTNTDPDGHDCVVQSSTSSTTESVSTTSGNCDNVSIGDGQSKTYVPGTVTSISANGGNSIDIGYNSYDGQSSGVTNAGAAPQPDNPGLAYNYGNNAQGYQQLGAASQFVKDATIGYTVAFGSVGAAIAGGEIAAGTAATRSQIIFRLAHGMRIAAGHSQVLADVGAVKNAIAAAVASGAVSSLGGNAFQGVVNVAGTYIRFTGAMTPAGTIISNVMGAALQR